jgi:hypothetical protein
MVKGIGDIEEPRSYLGLTVHMEDVVNPVIRKCFYVFCAFLS